MPKNGEETRLISLKNSSNDDVDSQTRQENTTKMKIWKIATAKFKCTREHILGIIDLLKSPEIKPTDKTES